MQLLEFQAKELFAARDITTPKATLITVADDLASVAYPVVLKAQVPVGGRKKAGAIKTVASMEEGIREFEKLSRMTVRGHRVRGVVAEEMIAAEREIYLAVLIDRSAKLPLLLASDAGGIDIETTARQTPEKVIRKHIHPLTGLPRYVLEYLLSRLSLRDHHKTFTQILESMIEIFTDTRAALVEINPLAVTRAGLVALDAKVVLDDKARHINEALLLHIEEECSCLVAETRSCNRMKLARDLGVTYVPLEGDVAVISDGAGTGMLTLDLIEDAGGQPANFCELGGHAGAETVQRALEVVLKNADPKVLLISLIGGLTRMDEIAEGIVEYLRRHCTTLPMVVRMCGTQEEVGQAMLRAAGIETYDNLNEAVEAAVKAVGKT
ncbi:ATP-grasp domain-containing protein [Candidatus Bipolaricaulota bacterium]